MNRTWIPLHLATALAIVTACGTYELPKQASNTSTSTSTAAQPQPPVVVNINNTQNNNQAGTAAAAEKSGMPPMPAACFCDPESRYCYSTEQGVECPQIYEY